MKTVTCLLLLLIARLATAGPANDSCSNAAEIQPGIYEGETCSASRDGANSCTPNATAGDVWYKYTPVANENLIATSFGSNYDSVLSVHTGCPGSASNQVACSDDCGNQGACTAFTATAGTTYWIRVSGFQNAAGRFHLVLAKDGGISGRIRDAAGNSPLNNVQVLIYLSDSLEFAKSVSTDNTGSYLITGLTPGDYIVRTSNSARYVDELFDNKPCEGLTCNPAVAKAVTVTAGQIRSGTDFLLDLGGNISGTVTDAGTGLPIQSVEVHVHDANNIHITLGFTDSTGHYSSFDGLPAGNYLILALNHSRYVDEIYNDVPCPAATCSGSVGTKVAVSLGATVPLDLALQPGGLITGTITDSGTGLPITGVQTLVYDPAIKRITSGSTDSTGKYKIFDGLPSGDYYVRTSNSKNYIDELFPNGSCMAGFCTPADGQLVTVVAGVESTADFQLDPGAKIEGTLTDAATAAPLPGLLVEILDSVNHHLRYEFTDLAGHYSTTLGLVSGNYFVKTRNQIGYLDEIYDDTPCVASTCNIATGTPIPAFAGQDAGGIDFDLNRGGTVSGKVTAIRNGLPLENVYVLAYDSTGALKTYGYSDSCGNYSTFFGVPNDTYYLRTMNSIGLLDAIYQDRACVNGVCSVLAGDPLAVTPGVKGIDFALSAGILLQDDFNDGQLTWNSRNGTWLESGGVLTGDSTTKAAQIRAPLPWDPSGEDGCSGCVVDVRMQSNGGRASIRAWYRDRSNYVELQMLPDKGKWKLRQVSGGQVVAGGKSAQSIQTGVLYEAKISFDGRSFHVWIDGVKILDMNAVGAPSGNLGFRVREGSASFDHILVY